MKTYVFEYVSRREIDAQSEEEARVKLAQQVVLEEEWELIDVWSAEEEGANGVCAYCGKRGCEHQAKAFAHLIRKANDAAST